MKGSVARSNRRRDIQGLRAVAILAVVAYHAGLPVPGGYVGVDVFFVISGYLITQLLYDELSSGGRFSFANFYARRARRLLPSAVLVIVVTVAASVVVLGPLEARAVGKDAVACALYVGNYRFALQATNYLSAQGPVSPLQNYWSLGVEEQFYLVWPALLLVASLIGRPSRGRHRRSSPDRSRWAVIGAVAVVGALSFWMCVSLTQTDQPWAFFSLPTRAWELAVGGAPRARGALRSTGPGVGSGDDRLGRPRRRGVVARRLRPADTLPRSGRTRPGGGHRSRDLRRYPQSDCRARPSARPGSPAADRRRLLHLVPLALAAARTCTVRSGAPSGTRTERGRLRVQSAPGRSDHRPPRAAGPSINMALGSHGAQPRGRRSAQSRRSVGGCGDSGGGATAGRQWSRHRLTTGGRSRDRPPLVGHDAASGRDCRLARRAGQPAGVRVGRQPAGAGIADALARRRVGRRPRAFQRRLLRRLHRRVGAPLPVRRYELLPQHRALR